MPEYESKVILSSIGHDPKGKWAPYFPEVAPVLDSIYGKRGKLMVFTSQTHPSTVNAALGTNWQVSIEDHPENPINGARMQALSRGLALGSRGNIGHWETIEKINDYWINYWDGDRLLHTATTAPDELMDFVRNIKLCDFLIAAASKKGLETYPESMTYWENGKSRVFGEFLGFQGDIANRGCFGFSRRFATFLLSTPFDPEDETDALFAVKALAFGKFTEGVGPADTISIGYKEYDQLAAFENWLFEGITPEESIAKNNNPQEAAKRAALVKACIRTFTKYARLYGLPRASKLSSLAY